MDLTARHESPAHGPSGGIAVRLFITCWLVYGLHFATNMVRENYLALSIGDRLSFRVDEYADLHDDIFEIEGRGWHIGSNPGASMLAAIPYALTRPIIDRVVVKVQRERRASRRSTPSAYDAPTETDGAFYREAWLRGFDVRFGLASFVMQWLCMAIISALGVVAMYLLLRRLLSTERTALWLALLYAFGTPVFLRTGFLNHNMILGHVALAGMLALWRPERSRGPGDRGSAIGWGVPPERRLLFAGLAGGLALLLDYSGLIFLIGLLCYGLMAWGGDEESGGRAKSGGPDESGRYESGRREGPRPSAARLRWLRMGAWYGLGAMGPIALLAFYQWKSFGNPFLPPQHWMPAVEYIEQGYQGLDLPRLELASALAFDYRYGLFVSCPLFLLALLAAPLHRRLRDRLPRRELVTCFAFSLALLVFFSGVHYTRWQFNTGIRYLAPAFPFLFLPAATVLQRLPGWIARVIGVLAVAQAWCMAMARDVSGGKVELLDPDLGLGVLDPILRVLTGGFQLPALTTISRMEEWAPTGGEVSPLPLFALLGVVLAMVWLPQELWGRRGTGSDQPVG